LPQKPRKLLEAGSASVVPAGHLGGRHGVEHGIERKIYRNLKDFNRLWLPRSGDDLNFVQPIPLHNRCLTPLRTAKATKQSPTAPRTDASLKTKAVELVHRLGVATTKDFAAIGVSRYYLCKLCAESVLARAGYSRYSAPAVAA
jgi:hypothetical protein